MADKIKNEITLLFNTKLDEKSKQEVGKNLKSLLENAAISFDEAETKRNLEPIVRMIKNLFDKAEIAFDADKLLSMPSRQALQEMAKMEVNQLQLAFDKALAKSGGIKIDFGDVDLSELAMPLKQIEDELSGISKKIADTTKKSVYEIEQSLKSISKNKSFKKIASPESIESTLIESSNDKRIHPSRASVQLERARDLYDKSVKEDNPWVVQYKYLLDFVSKYEKLTQQAKAKIEAERPEFKQLYDMLSPKAGAVKISLEHFVDVAKGNELSEYKNQPWAREKTLERVASALENGISVKEDGGHSESNESLKPKVNDGDKNKTLNTKTTPSEPVSDNAAKQSRIAEQEKIATMLKQEVVKTADTSAFNQKLFDSIEKLSNDIESAFKSMMDGDIDEDQFDDRLSELRGEFLEQFKFDGKQRIDDYLAEQSDNMGEWNSKKIYDKLSKKLSPEDTSWSRIEPSVVDDTDQNVANAKEIAKAAEKKQLADEAAAAASRKSAEEAERERVAKEATHKLNTYTGYRAVEPPNGSGKTKEDALSDWGGEYFSTNKDIAASYGENFYEKGHIIIGEITPKDPLIINANGLRWDEFDKMPGVKELFPSLLEMMKNPHYIGDDGQKYINEQAKLAGYDAVILENVQDALDGDIKEYGLSTTIAVLDDKIVSLVGSMSQLEAGTNRFTEVISAEIPSYYVKSVKDGVEISNNNEAEITTERAETDAINQQNEALKENIDLKAKANVQDDVIVNADTGEDSAKPSSGSAEIKASIDTEELRSLLNSITYNVKVVQDAEPVEGNKVSINADELRSVLDGITYNVKLAQGETDGDSNKIAIDEGILENVLNRITYDVKIAHDDSDKVANKIAIDESALEQTLNRVFGNILNPKDEGKKPEGKKEPWALEKTLNTTIKGVLDQIQTNTAKIDATSDTTGISEIKSILESINAKIIKGGVIATRGAVKQAGAQAVEPDVKRQTTRSNMMTSIINDYKTMGKLAAQFASDGNLETKAMLENLKEEIRRKRASLNITMDENANLREKYSIAFEAEKKLLEAAKQQKKINEQNKADVKVEKKRLADAKKLAQREAMVGKAGNAVGRAENTWMTAVGMEDELPKEFGSQIDDYYQKLDALRKKQAELKNSDVISEEDKADLIAQTNNVNKLTTEIGELIAEYQRLSGDNATVIGTNTLGDNAEISAYEQQLKQAVITATNGKAQIKNFDAATKTLTYTVKTGKNEFTEYTAAVRRIGGALVSVQGDTKKTETFLEATKRKMKEISSYMSGMALISRAGQELRRGIQYVREIDLALTELKKVTDETEESYDKFLDTAAKTADKVGSTIQKVVSSTADWARLNI